MADENRDQWCFAWIPQAAAAAGKTRATLVKDSKWDSRDVITVKFLDGDPSVQDRVRRVALEWTRPQLANLRLSFVPDGDALVRISFLYDGSWSTVGTGCKQVTDQSQPTMNFGWLNAQTPDDKLRRVVLHEFGHMLGLTHEHMHPQHGIQWDRDAVIRDLTGPPNNWSLEDIESNMFQVYDEKETNFSQFDPQSIMLYPIPSHWTRNGFSVGLNSELSPTDRSFIRQQYP
jgi:serralysin